MNFPTIDDARAAINEDNLIGSGSARDVYYDGGLWAFKVDTGEYNSNKNEFNNWCRLQRQELPYGVRIPEMYMLNNGILAVEYVKGTHPDTHCWMLQHDCDDVDICWFTELMDKGINGIKGFGDISFLNVILTDDAVYIIDLEF